MPSSPGKAKGGFVRTVLAALAVTAASAASVGRAEEAAAPKGPRPEGPSSREYAHRVVRKFEIGQGPRSYWLFEPAEPGPGHGKAPVVVFLHGWLSVNPGFYGAWIDHLVRSGRIVVFPRYQNDFGTLPRDFLPNAAAAIRDALDVLDESPRHVRADRDRVAFLGHSAGGNLAAQLAAAAADPHSGLPVPRLVIAMMPGEVVPAREPRLERIPASTLLLVMVGEDDLLVGDVRGRQIFSQATAVPRARKRYMLFRSDRHGFPPLVAEHTAPAGANRTLDTGDGLFRSVQMSLGEVNVLDRAGFWRVADAALETAFRGRTFASDIQDEVRFTHLGYWSDGRKVVPPLIGDDLSSMPRVALPNGVRLVPFDAPARIARNPADADTRVQR
jgi:dienelactone hydrolase